MAGGPASSSSPSHSPSLSPSPSPSPSRSPPPSIPRGRSPAPSPFFSDRSTHSLRNYSPPARLYLDIAKDVLPWTPLESLPASQQRYYTYVSIQPDEVRLLCISPGVGEDNPIYGALKTMHLDRITKSKLKYQALSYAWGTDKPADVIFLQDISIPRPRPGQHPETDMSLIAQQSKPHPFLVRSNLHSALRRLRSETKDVWVWIDAICINQADDGEKNHQLPKMPAVYGNAWNVTIWIGDFVDGDDAELALDILPSLLHLRHLDALLGDGLGGSGSSGKQSLRSVVAFAKLLCRPWFCRRWVIQEVAYARRLSIRCGDRILSWIDFADAVDLFMDRLEVIRARCRASALADEFPDALNEVESSGAGALVSLARNVFRKNAKGSIVSRPADLESLVQKAAQFAATDGRDAIYALLSLASDGASTPDEEQGSRAAARVPVPSYTRQVLDVYAEYVEYCIQKTGSLDVICRHWALDPRMSGSPFDNPPSWIGSTKNSAYGAPSRLAGRINSDSLVGDPGTRVYNATRGTKMVARLGRYPPLPAPSEEPSGGKRRRRDTEGSSSEEGESGDGVQGQDKGRSDRKPRRRRILTNQTWKGYIGATEWEPPQPIESLPHLYSYAPSKRPVDRPIFDRVLHARGVVVGRVVDTSPRIVDGMISQECFQTLHWHGKPEDPPPHVWRTLVADRGADGRIAPSWYRRACASVLANVGPEGDLNTSKLLGTKMLPTTVADYVSRAQKVLWSRKFFRVLGRFRHIKEKAFLYGTGPRAIEKDDIVCLLFGCSVPVIMRRRDPAALQSRVTLVGECYVHGIMEGEWFAEGVSRLPTDAVDFEIE